LVRLAVLSDADNAKYRTAMSSLLQNGPKDYLANNRWIRVRS
jgi:hypothetical protein